jgi:lipopolysaccharide transport system permease protein
MIRTETIPEYTAPPRAAMTGPEVELLLCCARTRTDPEVSDRIRKAAQKEIDWVQLIRLALRHGTLPLMSWNLDRICPDIVPNGVLEPLRTRYEAGAAEGRLLAEELVSILGLLDSQGIPAVPYKGPALAVKLYGDLSLRGFGDLDIVIHECDALRARHLLIDRGYTPAPQLGSTELTQYLRENHEMPFCRADGKARLDLHWRYTSRSACLAGDPERFLQHLEMISIAGGEVRSLRLETYLLVLSMHAAKHKWAQLKLICDIAEILAVPDLDWHYVLREADDLGLKRALGTGFLLAQGVLGAAVPAKLAQELKIDRVARALAEDARAELFEEADENWGAEADYTFQFELRERLRDRTKIFLQHWLPILKPNERDRLFLPLPRALSLLYYLVRPIRLVWESMGRRGQGGNTEPLRARPFELLLKPQKGWRPIDLRELWNGRETFGFLVWRDIKIRYKQTLLGGIWAVLQPFLAMLIFSVFFNRFAGIVSDGVPYPLFAYAGLILWTFFANSVSVSGNSLVGNQVLVSKIYFPRMFIPLASIAALLLDLLVSLAMLVALMVFYRWPLAAGVLWLPLFLLGTLIAASGLGLLLSALNVRFRDVKYAVPFFLQMGLFVTPVIYPLSYVPDRYRLLLELNPMTGMVEGFRSAALGGQTNWSAVCVSLVVSAVLFVVSLFIFRRMERHFADVI